jgi:uncharacterized protein
MAAAMAVLRIYTREDETWQGKSLHSALVEHARQSTIAGATVLRGIEGYGADRRIHTARLIDISPQLPMIVEFVDEGQKLRDFLASVEEMLGSGLATLQQVEVVRHVAGD